MPKTLGFNLVKARQIGGGYTRDGDGVYDGGRDPNQEGRGWLSPPFLPTVGAANTILPGLQSGGAVQTRRDRAAVDENKAAAIAAAMEESARLEAQSNPSQSRKKGVPTPPVPTKGPVLFGDNNLQQFMTALNLNYNRPGKRTRPHQRLMGWKLHGSKAGDIRTTKLARLIRQAKLYGVLNWKAGHDDLTFSPSTKLLNKYYAIASDLGYLKNPNIPSGNRENKKKKNQKGSKKAKPKKKAKKRPAKKQKKLHEIMGDAEEDVQSQLIEPLTALSTGQSGSGLNWKSLLKELLSQ